MTNAELHQHLLEGRRPESRATDRIMKPRPLSEWHAGIGDALWWKFPIEEAPYVGSPLDLGQTVRVDISVMTHATRHKPVVKTFNVDVGGWPGYHTHFTPLPPLPEAPPKPKRKRAGKAEVAG